MVASRFESEIMSHTVKFNRKFRVFACTGSYIQFVANSCSDYASACVYRTSAHTYRLMWYHSHLLVCKFSEFKSFRTLSDLCFYLDALSDKLV